jgi:hypothetical protein
MTLRAVKVEGWVMVGAVLIGVIIGAFGAVLFQIPWTFPAGVVVGCLIREL